MSGQENAKLHDVPTLKLCYSYIYDKPIVDFEPGNGYELLWTIILLGSIVIVRRHGRLAAGKKYEVAQSPNILFK